MLNLDEAAPIIWRKNVGQNKYDEVQSAAPAVPVAAIAEKTDAEQDCLAKAQARGQKTFTIVEQDITAPQAIAHWIELNIMHAPAAKLHEALDKAIACREFPSRKWAD